MTTSTTAPPYQVMPPLTPEEYAALEADIRIRGVLVPVVVDQHGNTIDGHHRIEIAERLGIKYDRLVQYCADDQEALTVARVYNLTRRHLSRVQRRALIADEITANPDRSDREIGRLFGVDHKTVGSVRRELRGELPHPVNADALTIPGDDADVARLTVDAIVRGYDNADTDEEKRAWAHAVQLTDEILAWGRDTTRPNLFWFTLVAQSMYCLQTNADVWELMAAWMVPVAKLALQECAPVHQRGDVEDLPGEALARLTVAIWDGDAAPELRWEMFRAMESRIVMAIARAAALAPIPQPLEEVC